MYRSVSAYTDREKEFYFTVYITPNSVFNIHVLIYVSTSTLQVCTYPKKEESALNRCMHLPSLSSALVSIQEQSINL